MGLFNENNYQKEQKYHLKIKMNKFCRVKNQQRNAFTTKRGDRKFCDARQSQLNIYLKKDLYEGTIRYIIQLFLMMENAKDELMSHFITFYKRTNSFATDQCDQNISNGK